MDLHVYVHLLSDSTVDHKLAIIIGQLERVLQKEQIIMAELDDLTTQVQVTADAEQSAIVLLNGLSAALAAAGTDPAKLAALRDSLKTNTDALAAAVVANTPKT